MWSVQALPGGTWLVTGYGGLRVLVSGPNGEADATAIAGTPDLINGATIALAWLLDPARTTEQHVVAALQFGLERAGAQLPTASTLKGPSTHAQETHTESRRPDALER